MTLEEFFALVEKAKKETPPSQLKSPLRLYVGNVLYQADAQEYGDSTTVYDLFLSGDCLHVSGG
jgi:hypothetical protein